MCKTVTITKQTVSDSHYSRGNTYYTKHTLTCSSGEVYRRDAGGGYTELKKCLKAQGYKIIIVK